VVMALALFGQVVAAEIPVLNQYILQAMRSMPAGMGYDASQKAVDRLAGSVRLDRETMQIVQSTRQAGACFCSGATYLVFLRTIEALRKNGSLKLPAKVLEKYANLDKKDGEGVFGRWNANGPGPAKLFTELGCGKNFTSYKEARPGDFMKIWWTREIGARERGHLVIYLGRKGESVTFWSANKPGGYGKKTVPAGKIKRVLFSRLTDHTRLKRAGKLSASNQFLADMLRMRFTWEEVVKECRVKEG